MEPAPSIKGLSRCRRRTQSVAMEITSGWIIPVIVVAAQVHPATQRTQFDCAITTIIHQRAGARHISTTQRTAYFLD